MVAQVKTEMKHQRTIDDSGRGHVRRGSGSGSWLQFCSWYRVPTGTSRLCQVDENLPVLGVLTVESVCMPQNGLRVQMIMGTAAVVRGRWGGWEAGSRLQVENSSYADSR
jgi:hypothetical protein